MNLRIACMTASLLAPAACAQEQLWIRQFGTSANDYAKALAPDGAGGVFGAGYTAGSLGGPALGNDDAWLTRYDGAGNRLWIRQFGTSAEDWATALAPDGAGGAFVAGETWGSLGGAHAGAVDAWLARYDSSGNRSWIRQFGTPADDKAKALAGDGAGGTFVAGWTLGSLAAPNPGGLTWQVFLARYDAMGTQVWIRQFGVSLLTVLSPDGLGGAYVAGLTDGAPNAGGWDAWLARYDHDGNRLWIRQFGTIYLDHAHGLALDGAGGVFVAGYTNGNLGGPNAGMSDVWIARYDGAGNQLWIRQFGTNDLDQALTLASDGLGGAFVAGRTFGSFGGGPGGNWDAWLARFDGAGSQQWIHQFGSNGARATGLAPDGAMGAFVMGDTSVSLGGPSAGGSDVWIARWTGGPAPCYPDCNGDQFLNLADFGCFQTKFAVQDPYADCNGDGALNLADFGCFQTKFALGCP